MVENKVKKDHELGMKDHWKALSIITLVSLSSFQYGLDFGIIGGLQAMIGFLQVFGERAPTTPLGWNINAERQQLISSLMILGAFISSSTAGFTAKYFGRKMSLWIACVGVFVSTAVMQATTQIGGLYAGRLIIGLANGLLMTHAQLYIQECSPGRYRGFGSLIGTVIDNFASKIDKARMDEAERALRRLRPAAWSVADELEEMKTTLAAEARLQSSVGYRTLFQNPIDRRRTFLSVFGLTTQAASGAMFAYGTYFFEMANVGNAFENSCILTGTGVAALLFNALVITKYGRRRVMMMSGFIVCGLSQLIMAIVYTVEPGTQKTGKVIVGLSVIYIVAYNALISTYAWLSGGELASQRLRSHTFGLATAIGFFGAWLTTFTAPYFINPTRLGWGPKYGYIWTGSCAIAGAWVWMYLPEVKGRTLEQIDEMFEVGVPARKFRKYQCTGHVDDEKPHVDHVESGSSQDDGSEPKKAVASVSTSKI
ncbi:hypothetical protein NPX13_g2234 [Xylaria arbuscula]|uniref:Major facilitator superfamily (MFS) profile domain-containing protein n=1 Tax=Xylaria arbuscula TaxID=114810 RepID=A0A9W8NKX1_9PEZI|nr:hypothetical protein NPX13_g2234 [Xylaria arbuscula]